MGRRAARSVAVAGPPAASAARIARRVGSARAVKTFSATASTSGRGGIEVLDQLGQFAGPALGVALEGGPIAVFGQLREAGFDHGQASAVVSRLEREFDIGPPRIVVWQAADAPGETEDGRLIDAFDAHRGLLAVRPGHLGYAARPQIDRRRVAEPCAQSLSGRQCRPYPGRR